MVARMRTALKHLNDGVSYSPLFPCSRTLPVTSSSSSLSASPQLKVALGAGWQVFGYKWKPEI